MHFKGVIMKTQKELLLRGLYVRQDELKKSLSKNSGFFDTDILKENIKLSEELIYVNIEIAQLASEGLHCPDFSVVYI